MMYALHLLHHAEAHVEPMEEHAGDPQRDLREVEQDAGLVDEVHALCPS